MRALPPSEMTVLLLSMEVVVLLYQGPQLAGALSITAWWRPILLYTGWPSCRKLPGSCQRLRPHPLRVPRVRTLIWNGICPDCCPRRPRGCRCLPLHLDSLRQQVRYHSMPATAWPGIATPPSTARVRRPAAAPLPFPAACPRSQLRRSIRAQARKALLASVVPPRSYRCHQCLRIVTEPCLPDSAALAGTTPRSSPTGPPRRYFPTPVALGPPS